MHCEAPRDSKRVWFAVLFACWSQHGAFQIWLTFHAFSWLKTWFKVWHCGTKPYSISNVVVSLSHSASYEMHRFPTWKAMKFASVPLGKWRKVNIHQKGGIFPTNQRGNTSTKPPKAAIWKPIVPVALGIVRQHLHRQQGGPGVGVHQPGVAVVVHHKDPGTRISFKLWLPDSKTSNWSQLCWWKKGAAQTYSLGVNRYFFQTESKWHWVPPWPEAAREFMIAMESSMLLPSNRCLTREDHPRKGPWKI